MKYTNQVTTFNRLFSRQGSRTFTLKSVLGLLASLMIGACTDEAGNDAATQGIEGTGNGTFPTWNICKSRNEPKIQKWQYRSDTMILRQSMCTSFEAPFLYFLMGKDAAFLFDSGTGHVDVSPDLFATVKALKGKRKLYVVSSHRHGDHTGSDWIFKDKQSEGIELIGGAWSGSDRSIDLGGRVLKILSIPGHEAHSIAVYDPKEKLLLTGDTLYSGHLFVDNWADMQKSFKKLSHFVSANPVTWILGGHIEVTKSKQFIRYGSPTRTDEVQLQLPTQFAKDVFAASVKIGSEFSPFVNSKDAPYRFNLCRFSGKCE